MTNSTDFPVISASVGRRQDRLRAGGLALPARSEGGQGRRSSRSPCPPTSARPGRAGSRAPTSCGACPLPYRRAAGVRNARRDRHRARREGRSAEPHQHARRERAVAGLVARRASIAFFSDQGGENPPAPRAGRRQGRAPRPRSRPAPASTSTCSGRPTASGWRGGTIRRPSTSSTWRAAAPARWRPTRSTPRSVSISFAWSPDSRWLAYTVLTQPLVSALFLYDADQDRSTQVPTASQRSPSPHSTGTGSTSTCWPRPMPAPSSTGSPRATPGSAAPGRSTRSRSRSRRPTRSRRKATRRSPRPGRFTPRQPRSPPQPPPPHNRRPGRHWRPDRRLPVAPAEIEMLAKRRGRPGLVPCEHRRQAAPSGAMT